MTKEFLAGLRVLVVDSDHLVQVLLWKCGWSFLNSWRAMTKLTVEGDLESLIGTRRRSG